MARHWQTHQNKFTVKGLTTNYACTTFHSNCIKTSYYSNSFMPFERNLPHFLRNVILRSFCHGMPYISFWLYNTKPVLSSTYGYKVYSTAGDFYASFEHLSMSVGSLERGQQRRMHIQHFASPLVHEATWNRKFVLNKTIVFQGTTVSLP